MPAVHSTHAAGSFAYVQLQAVAHSQQHSFAISSGTPLSVVTLLGAFIQPGFPFCLFNFRLFQDPSWDFTLRKVLFNTATPCAMSYCHVQVLRRLQMLSTAH